MSTHRTSRGAVITALFLAVLVAGLPAFPDATPQSSPELARPAIYVVGDYLHINANGPRPLLQAINSLQQMYGWAIDYEEPQYINASFESAPRQFPPHRLRSMAQTGNHAGGGFSLQFNIAEYGNAPPDQTKLLTAVVNAYNESNGAAEFKLLNEAGSRFTIVGAGVRDTNGELVIQPAVLDQLITIPKSQRSVAETISLICNRVSMQSKVTISIHLDPALSPSTAAAIGGQSMPAREMLSEAVTALGSKAHWRLLYEDHSRTYTLNISQLSP